MKKLSLIPIFAMLVINSIAQTNDITLDDEEFLVNKKVVAKVKNVKLGFLQGKEIQLQNESNAILATVNIKSVVNAAVANDLIMYCHIFIPSVNDSIQIYKDSVVAAINKKSGLFSSLDEEDWAAYFYKVNFITSGGTLNMDAVKALKQQYPVSVVELNNRKAAEIARCDKSVKKPNIRNFNIPAKITEMSRETTANVITIKYQIEHDGKIIGSVIGIGNPEIVANERAEIDFKMKLLTKKAEIPMTFEFFNADGCSLAHYTPAEKKLYTVRADKGGWHGIMSPILAGKVDTIKNRIEIVAGMADYLIQLTYL